MHRAIIFAAQITRNQPVYYEAMVGGEDEGGVSDRDSLGGELRWRGGCRRRAVIKVLASKSTDTYYIVNKWLSDRVSPASSSLRLSTLSPTLLSPWSSPRPSPRPGSSSVPNTNRSR